MRATRAMRIAWRLADLGGVAAGLGGADEVEGISRVVIAGEAEGGGTIPDERKMIERPSSVEGGTRNRRNKVE